MDRLKQAKQIASGLTNYLKVKAMIADPEVETLQKKRYAVCLECPNRNPEKDICLVCGCFLPFKTRALEASCPEEHWVSIIKIRR